jgi:hypothetical protein
MSQVSLQPQLDLQSTTSRTTPYLVTTQTTNNNNNVSSFGQNAGSVQRSNGSSVGQNSISLRPGTVRPIPLGRMGGSGGEVLFPDEVAELKRQELSSKSWTTPQVIAWIFMFIFILAIIGLLIWWIVRICSPSRPSDLSARDVHARDIAASGNVTVGGNLTVVAGTTKFANTLLQAVALPPVNLAGLNILLDGTESSISLTNQSGNIVTVTLPSATAFPGLLVFVLNETTNPVFHVDPQGTDTIEGSSVTAVENSSALFISSGNTPAGIGNWKQIM